MHRVLKLRAAWQLCFKACRSAENACAHKIVSSKRESIVHHRRFVDSLQCNLPYPHTRPASPGPKAVQLNVFVGFLLLFHASAPSRGSRLLAATAASCTLDSFRQAMRKAKQLVAVRYSFRRLQCGQCAGRTSKCSAQGSSAAAGASAGTIAAGASAGAWSSAPIPAATWILRMF